MSEEGDPSRLPWPRRLRYIVEAALWFFFIGFFRLLGLDGASAVGGFIGREVFSRIGVVDRARTNLRDAFPEKSASEIEVIVREMCDNLGRTVAEYAHLDKIGTIGPDARIEVVGADEADEVVSRGKGVIFFSGHFANWEVMPFIAEQRGWESGEVYRPQNNPYVDRWLVRQRAKNGPKDQIAKGPRGTRRIFTLLRRGKCVCLLVDQKTNEGVPSVYFGREAMTTPAPAALALKLGALLCAAQLQRTSGSHFRAYFHPPIEFSPSGDHDRDVIALTQAITDKIESIVRERPSQWLWIHRRWPTAREQDQVRGKRAVQGAGSAGAGGAGVRAEREGSSLT